MTVESVKFKNVRNYADLELNPSAGVNIFYGENAQGKTNLIEGIYFCATGRSHRTSADKDMIKFGENEAHLRVTIKGESGYSERIDAHLKQSAKGASKGIAINGVAVKRLGELFGALLTVVFSPEDLSLVKAGPGERRRYIDMEMCQLSKIYCYELTQYHKALKHRNALLKEIQKRRASEDELTIWDEQLIKYGAKITEQRTTFIKKLSEAASQVHGQIAINEKLEIAYKPDASSEELADRLTKSRKRDILIGATNRGPHKDEIAFIINNENARSYGSQGQQRTAGLSAKLAEIEVIKETKRSSPVLLLDDVFSELDETRAKRLVEKVSNLQTLITCAGAEEATKRFGGGEVSLYHVKEGRITDCAKSRGCTCKICKSLL